MKSKITYLIMTIVLLSCNSNTIDSKNTEILEPDSINKNQSRIKIDNLLNVDLNGNFDVILSKKISEEIIIESKIGTGDSVVIKKKNKTHVIGVNPKYKTIYQSNITIYIPVQKLKSVTYNGTGSVKSESKLVTSDFKLKLNGQFTVNLVVDINQFTIDKNGDGECHVSGKATNNSINSNGNGQIDLQSLQSENVTINNNGAGKIDVKASNNMAIDNIGVGSVLVHGTPKQKKFNNVGLGKIVEVK